MSKSGVVIIGATSAIAQATARRLAADGRPLFLAGRNEKRLGTIARELGAPYHVLTGTDFDSIAGVVDSATGEIGPISGIVNCIGSIVLKPAHITAESDYDSVLDTNLRSAFATVRSGAKAMLKTGGSIVLISSAAAQTGLTNHEMIAAAKGAIISLTRAAAASYATKQIRVNAVAPGLIDTPAAARLLASEASRQASESMHALGRVGKPDDVASAITWLLDHENSFVTGQVVGVDGGLGHVRPR